MVAKIAFLFPGQGSQYTGMGKALYEEFSCAREIYDEAEAALGWDIKGLCFYNRDGKIDLTEYTQPAILVTSIAALVTIQKEGIKPHIVAGHSLGEYSALVASKGAGFIDIVKAVEYRGQVMQKAVREGEGKMAAIIGLPPEEVENICTQASSAGMVVPANYNSHEQIVIAGQAEGVEKALDIARRRGAKRVVSLNVSVPSHSPLMEEASEKFKNFLENITFHNLSIPLITNVDARIVHTAHEIKDALIRQLTNPVRWYQSMKALIGQGINVFIEIGPGRVLSGLLKRITRQMKVEATILNIEDDKSFHKTMEVLNGLPVE